MFKKATKEKLKLRAALFGPSGAGKTFSALRVARGLGGTVALIDTERKSASKYADRFEFDTCDLANRTIEGYVEAIKAASSYDVLVIDSLSHAWQELLEEMDRIANNSRHRGNKWSAWSEGTPKQRRLVDAILDFPGHVIATMRSKTEWVTTEDRNGKKKPERVGLSPEQGKGIEYEFDLLVELTSEHVAQVIKDRTGKFQDVTITKPGEDFGKELAAWLGEGEEPPPRAPSRPAPRKPSPAAFIAALKMAGGCKTRDERKALLAKVEGAGKLATEQVEILNAYLFGLQNISDGGQPEDGMTPDELDRYERALQVLDDDAKKARGEAA